MPPKITNIKPLITRLEYNAWKKNNTNQPITIYSTIDIWKEYLKLYTSRIIPKMARDHIKINKNNPGLGYNDINVNGV